MNLVLRIINGVANECLRLLTSVLPAEQPIPISGVIVALNVVIFSERCLTMIKFFSCEKCSKEFSIASEEMKRQCPFCLSKKLLVLRRNERVRKDNYLRPCDTLPSEEYAA